MSDLLAPVDIEFELSVAENVAALRWHVIHTGGFRLSAPVGVGAAALLGASLRFNGWSWSSTLLAAAGTIVVGAILVAWVFPWLSVIRSPQLTQNFAFTFAESHVWFVAERTDGRIDWDGYDRWRVSPRFYFLYFDGDQFTVIPRRAFEDDTDEERFVALLEAKIG